MKKAAFIFALMMFCLVFQPTVRFLPSELQTPPAAAASQPTLVWAAVCESVKELTPQDPAIVFSFAVGKISCFCAFDPVPDKTFIYHNWYYRDKLITTIKLTLTPPRWSTFSSIELRETDIGPWRVDITDPNGIVIKILRFSVSE